MPTGASPGAHGSMHCSVQRSGCAQVAAGAANPRARVLMALSGFGVCLRHQQWLETHWRVHASFRLVDEDGQPVGPHRVWLQYAWVPGLAMSRALGDQLAHQVHCKLDMLYSDASAHHILEGSNQACVAAQAAACVVCQVEPNE